MIQKLTLVVVGVVLGLGHGELQRGVSGECIHGPRDGERARRISRQRGEPSMPIEHGRIAAAGVLLCTKCECTRADGRRAVAGRRTHRTIEKVHVLAVSEVAIRQFLLLSSLMLSVAAWQSDDRLASELASFVTKVCTSSC